MELYQLRTFIAVIEEKSLSGAGRRLSMTTSSVSAHIKALETEWDVMLFIRTSQGVVLTEKGRILADHARYTLQAAGELSRQVDKLKDSLIGILRLGLSVSSGVFSLSHLLDYVHRRYPDITMTVSSDETIAILDLIQRDKLDIGIVFGQVEDATMTTHHLTMAELVLAMPKAWGGVVNQNWESLDHQIWIHTGDECPFQPMMDDLCQQHGIQPQQFVRINNDRTRRDLVIAGMGVSLLEVSEATHPDIDIFDKVNLMCPVSLVYSAHRQFDPMIQAIRLLILEALKD